MWFGVALKLVWYANPELILSNHELFYYYLFYEVKMFNLRKNIQTTAMTFVPKKRYTIHDYSIVYFQIVRDTQYTI